MSFYMEAIDDNGIQATYLIRSFKAATEFSGARTPPGTPDPDRTAVWLDGVSNPVVVKLGYEAFKRELLDSQEQHRIPSFRPSAL